MLAACFSTFFYPAIGALLPSLIPATSASSVRQTAPWATLDNWPVIVGTGIAGLL